MRQCDVDQRAAKSEKSLSRVVGSLCLCVMLDRPKPRSSCHVFLRLFDRVAVRTHSPRARVDRLACAVRCVRCELVLMTDEVARVFMFLLALKVFADAMGWTQ